MNEQDRHWSPLQRGAPTTCHIAIGEYLASHDRTLGILLHDGHVPWGDHLVITGVRAIYGPLEGGPYQLRLTQPSEGRPGKLIGVGGNDRIEIHFEGPIRLYKSRWGA